MKFHHLIVSLISSKKFDKIPFFLNQIKNQKKKNQKNKMNQKIKRFKFALKKIYNLFYIFEIRIFLISPNFE